MGNRRDTPEAREFIARLNAVWDALGRPSARRLNEALTTASKQGELPKQTLSNLLNGVVLPRWDTVAKFLTACEEYQKRNGVRLPEQTLNAAAWKHAHEKADSAGKGSTDADPAPTQPRTADPQLADTPHASAEHSVDTQQEQSRRSTRNSGGDSLSLQGRGERDTYAVDLPDTKKEGSDRRKWLLVGAIVIVAVASGLWMLTNLKKPTDDAAPASKAAASPTTSFTANWPDAAHAPADITQDGQPIVLDSADPGRCESAAKGAARIDDLPYIVDGREVARIWTYYSTSAHQACAKLVKPVGSPYAGLMTHMALTLCGDMNTCDFDWNTYSIDAGPVVVPSTHGCMSWRVSLTDESKTRWLLRDELGSSDCPTGE